MEKKIKDIVYKNRMSYELWMESASSYPNLIKSLKKRYKRVPATPKPLLWGRTYNKKEISQNLLDIIGNKTMLKRNSKKPRR